MDVSGLTSRSFLVTPQKNTGIHLIVGWMGPRGGLEILDGGGTVISKTLSFVASTEHCTGLVVSLPRE
jgi:hypothetical protein